MYTRTNEIKHLELTKKINEIKKTFHNNLAKRLEWTEKKVFSNKSIESVKDLCIQFKKRIIQSALCHKKSLAGITRCNAQIQASDNYLKCLVPLINWACLQNLVFAILCPRTLSLDVWILEGSQFSLVSSYYLSHNFKGAPAPGAPVLPMPMLNTWILTIESISVLAACF